MKKYMTLIWLLLALAAMPALAQKFTFDYPKAWTLETVPDQKDPSAAPTAQFTSESDNIVAGVSILQGRDAAGLKPDDLRDIVMAMASDMVPKSREGKATVVAFGDNRAGMYIRLTDKGSKGAYKYLTVAIHRSGQDLAMGQMTSNDDDGAMLKQFLGVVGSVVSGPPQVARPGTGKLAEQDVWGAIAIEQAKGDTDPYFGIGGGDSQAEAEKNAQRFCREAGAKRCVVQVTYTQCGAYAVSATGFGRGIGASQKAAEKAALTACNDKNCSLVTSDCN